MRFGWMLVGLVACSDKDEAPLDGTDDTDTPEATDTGGGGGGSTTTPQSLSLTVVDAAGAPLSGINVKFCNVQGCRTFDTLSDGVAVFDNALLLPYSLEPVPPIGSGLSTAYIPLEFAADEAKVMTIVMPPLGAPTALGGSSEVTFGDLAVTVSSTTLVAPDPFSDPPTEVAGVQVDPADWPPISKPGTVLGVWYLSPFNYDAPTGLPARFTNTFGVAPGGTAHVWIGSYDDFAWLDGGTVTESMGSLTGASLPLVSTVVLIAD